MMVEKNAHVTRAPNEVMHSALWNPSVRIIERRPGMKFYSMRDEQQI